MSQLQAFGRSFFGSVSKLWKRGIAGKATVGCAGILFVCVVCSICGWVFSLTPQGQESARKVNEQSTATAVAHVAEVNATATEKAKPTNTPPPTNTPGPTATRAPTDVPEPTEPRVATLSAVPTLKIDSANALVSLARDKFGENFMTAQIADVAGKSVATIDYDLGVQWDEGTAVFSAQRDFMEIAPQVFAQTAAEVLELRAFTDFKDALGNTKKEVAIKFTLSRALAKKINWDGILQSRLGDALATDTSSGVYVHPALKKAWNDSQK